MALTVAKCLRVAAAGFAFAMGAGCTLYASYQIVTAGHLVDPPHPAPSTLGDSLVIVLWFACVAFTAWRGFDRECAS